MIKLFGLLLDLALGLISVFVASGLTPRLRLALLLGDALHVARLLWLVSNLRVLVCNVQLLDFHDGLFNSLLTLKVRLCLLSSFTILGGRGRLRRCLWGFAWGRFLPQLYMLLLFAELSKQVLG